MNIPKDFKEEKWFCPSCSKKKESPSSPPKAKAKALKVKVKVKIEESDDYHEELDEEAELNDIIGLTVQQTNDMKFVFKRAKPAGKTKAKPKKKAKKDPDESYSLSAKSLSKSNGRSNRDNPTRHIPCPIEGCTAVAQTRTSLLSHA